MWTVLWRACRRSVGAACLILAIADGALAQTPRPDPPRPTGAIFAGAAQRPDPADGTNAQLGLSLYGGYDDDFNSLQDGSGSAAPPEGLVAGYYGGVGGSLVFVTGGARNPVIINASGELRRYEGLGGIRPVQRRADFGYAPRVGRRWQFRIGQSVDYSPFYQFGLTVVSDPQTTIGTSADARAAARDTLNLDSSVEGRYQASRYSLLTLRAGYRISEVTDMPDLDTRRAGISWTRQMGRFGSLRLGYEFEETAGPVVEDESGAPVYGEPFRLHNIDTGFGYRRPLSFSRRTTVGFSTGFVTTRQFESDFATVTGTATIEHQIGRSWTAAADFRRAVQVQQVVGAPVLDNGLRARLNGLLTSRLDLLVGGEYRTGEVDPSTAVPNTDYYSTSTTARVRFALSGRLAVYSEYGYYRYRFDEGVTLPLGFARQVNRHSARAGLTLLVPVLTPPVERGSRDSR